MSCRCEVVSFHNGMTGHMVGMDAGRRPRANIPEGDFCFFLMIAAHAVLGSRVA